MEDSMKVSRGIKLDKDAPELTRAMETWSRSMLRH
jgi:hypothetical protein